jgi:hypothetical protein
MPSSMIAHDVKIEIARNAERARDIEARAALGHIAHDAADACGATESNRRCLEDPVSLTFPVLDHDDLTCCSISRPGSHIAGRDISRSGNG